MKTNFLLWMVFLALVLPFPLEANQNKEKSRAEKFLSDLVFSAYATYYSEADSPQKFMQVFGRDLSAEDKKVIEKHLAKTSLPKVSYLGEGRLQFEGGGQKSVLEPVDFFTQQYKLNDIVFVYNPRQSFEKQLDLLVRKMEQAAKKSKVSYYDLLVPRAHANPLFYAIGVGVLHAARFAAPYVARAGAAVLSRGAALTGKVIEVGGVGMVTGAAIVSRQDGVPFERALYCIFWGLTGQACEKEQVKAKLGEPSPTFESMKFTINSCPSSKIPEFVLTVVDEKERTKISRIMRFNEKGEVTEIQEYHAKETYSFGGLNYIVDPSKSISYSFDAGRFSKVRKMKFKSEAGTSEFLLENSSGYGFTRKSVILDPRIKGDNVLEEAMKARNDWIAGMRDQENDETILDKDAEKSDDLKKKEAWSQYATVISIMDRLIGAACDPLARKELEQPSKTKAVQ